jgi:hypothetical protein
MATCWGRWKGSKGYNRGWHSCRMTRWAKNCIQLG